VNCSTGGFAAG